VGLNFPVALNPALAKTIGTMMKVDYQRAVQLRIPRMDAEPDRHYRPTVFICDEYQNFATVGGDNPNGDERFLSLSRQPKCIPIVATQSVSSLKEALTNDGVKTLLQAFRTKVFLTTSDPETARYASELCGKEDRTQILEDVAELYIRKPHVISAEAQLDTHKSQIGFADLLKAALRHRPDRIIVGEIRGPEARVFLDALNTGHRGSITTIHANSASDALRRLAQLAMRASGGGVPLHDVEEECGRSIDVIVQVMNQDGWRHVTEIRTSADAANTTGHSQ
jgi:hypothetical protein